MARAETIENIGQPGGGGGGGGGGGSGPLPSHSTCRMELPRPFHSWPGLLTTTTTITTGSVAGSAPTHLHPHLHPLHAVCLRAHQQLPASPPTPPPPSPPCNRRDESSGGFSGDQTDSTLQGPLPDLLPQNEHPSWAWPRPRGPREAAVQLEVRVAHQLRSIGDQLNASALQRAGAPLWPDWRDACRGLLTFITQTLNTLYRLT